METCSMLSSGKAFHGVLVSGKPHKGHADVNANGDTKKVVENFVHISCS